MIITEAEYDDVLKLRQQVMYPDRDIDFVKLPTDNVGLHIGIIENNELVSVMSLFIEGRDVQFRKLATRKDQQGKGYASILMQWLIDYAKDMKLNKLWCNSRKEVAGFYKKFEYVQTDKKISQNGYDYIVMERIFSH